jgi:formylmethanofuran dehydrogenase subunit E
MGRRHVYVQGTEDADADWMHEDDVAQSFAQAMAGEGVTFTGPPREGKINLLAARDGLLRVDAPRLESFNSIPGVMCACRRNYTVVNQGQVIAGTRAIPLFLPLPDFHQAMDILEDEPLFKVVPMRPAKVGILVTGTEVFRGLVQDRFAPIITAKVEKRGCRVVDALIVPDVQQAITQGVKTLLEKGIDLLVTTAGLSVDPDDVTRQGLQEAGATAMLYGAPILPGAMTLLAHIGSVQVIGVPACALYFNHTSFDLLLPRLLAEVPISRQDLAQMGHGALCQECPTCNFPRCPFGS